MARSREQSGDVSAPREDSQETRKWSGEVPAELDDSYTAETIAWLREESARIRHYCKAKEQQLRDLHLWSSPYSAEIKSFRRLADRLYDIRENIQENMPKKNAPYISLNTSEILRDIREMYDKKHYSDRVFSLDTEVTLRLQRKNTLLEYAKSVKGIHTSSTAEYGRVTEERVLHAYLNSKSGKIVHEILRLRDALDITLENHYRDNNRAQRAMTTAMASHIDNESRKFVARQTQALEEEALKWKKNPQALFDEKTIRSVQRILDQEETWKNALKKCQAEKTHLHGGKKHQEKQEEIRRIETLLTTVASFKEHPVVQAIQTHLLERQQAHHGHTAPRMTQRH